MEDANPSSDNDIIELERLAENWFGEFKNRRIYTTLSSEIIKTIPDDKLQQAILDFIGRKIDNDWENDVKKVPALGPGFSAVYFLSGLETEVNNGGFNQLFYNCGRDAVLRAKDGADLLGLSALAEVVSRALQIEDTERDKMTKVKQAGTLEAFFESYDHISFEAADDEFTRLDLDLQKAIVLFIRSHGDLFEGRAND